MPERRLYRYPNGNVMAPPLARRMHDAADRLAGLIDRVDALRGRVEDTEEETEVGNLYADMRVLEVELLLIARSAS